MTMIEGALAHERAALVAESGDLEELIKELHRNGIYVGMQSSAAGLDVWITDRLYLRRAERLADPGERNALCLWLHMQALHLFPESAYARNVTADRELQNSVRLDRLNICWSK